MLGAEEQVPSRWRGKNPVRHVLSRGDYCLGNETVSEVKGVDGQKPLVPP